MIVIEGSFWPLVVVGAVADLSGAPAGVVLLDEERLNAGNALLMALVVPGRGEQAARAQQELLQWMQRYRSTVGPRTLRLAWVIEDGAIRACTEAWLTLESHRLLTLPSTTFTTVRAAISWLLDTPSWWSRPGEQSLAAEPSIAIM